jgi:cytochrome c oxidase subunit 3
MNVTVLFIALLMAIGVFFFLQQGLTEKPWLEQGVPGSAQRTGALEAPAPKLGLWVFLGVVGVLFVLLVSAYFMRMGATDWRSLKVPQLLWANTGVLILSSVAFQGATIAVHRAQMDALKAGLAAGCVFGLLFLGGQLLAWRQLTAAGNLVSTNPADSFFYLLTGLHGLHILGGLVAGAIVARKAWLGYASARLSASVEMCATYWHFLLFIWLVLFVLLLGWADDFGLICRQLLSS